MLLKAGQERRLWSRAVEGNHPWQGLETAPRPGVENLWRDRFSFASNDAIDGAWRMLQQFLGNEGGAMPPNEHEAGGLALLRGQCQLDYFWNVRQVIQREANRCGLKVS